MKRPFLKSSELILTGLILGLLIFAGCSDDNDDSEVNTAPRIVSALEDLSLAEGFGSAEVSTANVFVDDDGDEITLMVTSSDETVVTVTLTSQTITITEIGTGNTTITLNASDSNGGTSSDSFVVTVIEGTTVCSNDNSIDQDNWTCDETPVVQNSYESTLSNGVRTVTTNGIPNHDYRNQLPPDLAGELNSTTKVYELDATPSLASAVTGVVNAAFRPDWKFGIALNGVPLDPAPAEPFIFEDVNTGEYNWDWVMEPNNNQQTVGLDCATAHVQPDGTYHYHGDPIVYANTLMDGLGTGTTVPTEPVQIGWGADGFPVLYKYGPGANGGLELLSSSYQLKSGNRDGDGITEPCGEYNGKYTNDYQFVSGSGDLDECNGIERQLAINGEVFSYFYVITDDFPVISRCISGTPAAEFKLGPG